MDERNADEAEAMFNMVRRRYGDRLSDEELDEVRKRLETIVEGVQALRSVPLENGDEPFSLFAPYRRGD